MIYDLICYIVIVVLMFYAYSVVSSRIEGLMQDRERYEKKVDTLTNQVLDMLQSISLYSKSIEKLGDEIETLKSSRDKSGKFASKYSEEEKERALRYMYEHEEQSIKELSDALGIPCTTLRNWAKGQRI